MFIFIDYLDEKRMKRFRQLESIVNSPNDFRIACIDQVGDSDDPNHVTYTVVIKATNNVICAICNYIENIKNDIIGDDNTDNCLYDGFFEVHVDSKNTGLINDMDRLSVFSKSVYDDDNLHRIYELTSWKICNHIYDVLGSLICGITDIAMVIINACEGV